MNWKDLKVERVTKFKREYRRCSMCPATFKTTNIDWYPWPIDLDLCATCVRPFLDESSVMIGGSGEEGWVRITATMPDGGQSQSIGMRYADWQRVFPQLTPHRRLTLL